MKFSQNQGNRARGSMRNMGRMEGSRGRKEKKRGGNVKGGRVVTEIKASATVWVSKAAVGKRSRGGEALGREMRKEAERIRG